MKRYSKAISLDGSFGFSSFKNPFQSWESLHHSKFFDKKGGKERRCKNCLRGGEGSTQKLLLNTFTQTDAFVAKRTYEVLRKNSILCIFILMRVGRNCSWGKSATWDMKVEKKTANFFLQYSIRNIFWNSKYWDTLLLARYFIKFEKFVELLESLFKKLWIVVWNCITMYQWVFLQFKGSRYPLVWTKTGLQLKLQTLI